MEYLIRQQRALAEARARGADTLLVTRLTSVRYLTGFTGTAGVLLLDDDPLLVVDFRYSAQAQEQAVGVRFDGDSAPPRLWPRAMELMAERSGRVGIDLAQLTALQFRALDEGVLAGRWLDTTGLIEGLRSVKDADELDALKDALHVAENVLDQVGGWLVAGRTENEIAGEIERAQRALGSERSAAPILVSSGYRSTMPHGQASSKLLAEGEPVLVDLSPVIRGYRADITRTFFLGKPSADYRRLHEAILRAQDAALGMIRAGVAVKEVDALARSILAEYDLAQYFKHSLGHGIGLDQHEPPLLSAHDESILAPGVVIMVEPGVYVPGLGGTRVEDAVVVTETGCELLSEYSRDIVEVL